MAIAFERSPEGLRRYPLTTNTWLPYENLLRFPPKAKRKVVVSEIVEKLDFPRPVLKDAEVEGKSLLLVRFKLAVFSDSVVRVMTKMKIRPSGARELLLLTMVESEVLLCKEVVALGTKFELKEYFRGEIREKYVILSRGEKHWKDKLQITARTYERTWPSSIYFLCEERK